MYCGLFCDQEKMRSLQRAYETSCIAFVAPPSQFELDSPAHDPIPHRRSNLTAEVSNAE